MDASLSRFYKLDFRMSTPLSNLHQDLFKLKTSTVIIKYYTMHIMDRCKEGTGGDVVVDTPFNQHRMFLFVVISGGVLEVISTNKVPDLSTRGRTTSGRVIQD